MARTSRQSSSSRVNRRSSEQYQLDLMHVEPFVSTPVDSLANAEALLQVTADSTPEPSGRILQAEAELVSVPNDYGVHVTAEGLSIQTLQPPAPDAAQAAAGRIRRARAALAARTQQMHGPLPMPPRKQLQRPASPAPEQLTGVMLLQAGKASSPEDVEVAKLQGLGIAGTQLDSPAQWINLRYLDLSGNRLMFLAHLAMLPALHTLLLSGNCINSLADCGTDALSCLETLDVSYNGLQPKSLPQLGLLPQLRQLDVSGNRLGSWAVPKGSFPLLRVLKAAGCSFHTQCLHQLAVLPSLTDLHLPNNQIATVPEGMADNRPFLLLQLLDLGCNRLAAVHDVKAATGLPSLQRLVLMGNPVAARPSAFTKAFCNAILAGSGVVIARDSTTAHSPTTTILLLTIQLQPEPQEAPLIAHFLPPDLPHIEDLPLQGMDVTPGALAFEFSHTRIAEVFDRLQEDIQLWSADLADEPAAVGPADVPAEVFQQQQEDDGAAQRAAEDAGAQSAASEQGSVETSHGGDAEAYSHITDPTVQLAVALGLDPRQLTMYSGRQGTDSASAVAALQFALGHPLTEADEGLHKVPHFHQSTRSVAAKRTTKTKGAAVQQPDLPLSFRMDKINTIEGILSGMKTRISGLEKTLVSQLDLKKQQGLKAGVDAGVENGPAHDMYGITSLAMPTQQ